MAVKAPIVNNAIYVKILELKHNNQNKLFHTDKLKKADIIKGYNPHPSKDSVLPKKAAPTQSTTVPESVRTTVSKSAVRPALSAATKPAKQPVAQVNSINHENMISFDSQPIDTKSAPPFPAKVVGTTTE